MGIFKRKRTDDEIVKIAQAFSILGYDSNNTGYFIIDNDEEQIIRDFRQEYNIDIGFFQIWEKIFRYSVANVALREFLFLQDKKLKQRILEILRIPETLIIIYGFNETLQNQELDYLRDLIQMGFALFIDKITAQKAKLLFAKSGKLFDKAGVLAHKFMFLVSNMECKEITGKHMGIHMRLSMIISNNLMTFPDAINEFKKNLNLK